MTATAEEVGSQVTADTKDDYVEDKRAGEFLANPPAGDEVVISGLAGMYPDSKDVYHFRDNLYNKVNMVSDDDRRWTIVHPEIPKRSGMLYDIEKYDAGFFGTHYRQSHASDPVVRLFLERAVEAVLDAGINPKELEGTNTGVVVGACFSESDKTWFADKLYPQYYAVTGLERSMIPNRLSYYLKLNGPSHTVDTACSSSLYAVEHAYRLIRSGHCDSVIVGGTNLCLHPFVSLQFARLGVLSRDGACKVFDANGDGYARSEAVAAIFLQKAKNARRVYGQIIHAKTNCDGYKEQGITFPSSAAQKKLMSDVYQECNVDPTSLSFLEAHGTGTKVGDPEEVEAIDAVFCKNRERPLLVGSVKSNIGHSEPSSGLCSITKVIIGMENGIIPPNMNYNRPREDCEALEKGRLKVVTEKTPFEDDRGLIGVNSFGFGGGNCHVLMRWNTKQKVDRGRPDSGDELPRLVCVSGRKHGSIDKILDDVASRDLDEEYIRLYHQIFSKDMTGHLYRGYSILSRSGEFKRSSYYYAFNKRPFYLAFSDFDDSWLTLANDLYVHPLFAASIKRVQNILAPSGINLVETLLNGNQNPKLTGFDKMLGTVAVQIGIADILKILNLSPEGYFGTGVSEFVCAYLDQALTLQETIYCVYKIASLAEKDVGGDLPSFFNKNKVQIQQALEKVLTRNQVRSAKWISAIKTTNASVEHFINSLCSSVDFENIAPGLTRNSLVVQVGTGHVWTSSRNQLEFMTFARNSDEIDSNGFSRLLDIVGRLYELGHNASIEKLYPKIQYPVSRGTPMISPLIEWDHSRDWFFTYYTADDTIKCGQKNMRFSPSEDAWMFLAGHVIDGRNLFPATGYLYFVWEVLGIITGIMTSDMSVVFEDCRFLRATQMTKDIKTDLIVMIQRGSGNFEVAEGGEAVATGRIRATKGKEVISLPIPQGLAPEEAVPLGPKDIYKELRLRGYNYKGIFRKLRECDGSCTKGLIHWDGNWITFMDTMLQMKILQIDTRYLYVPTGIRRMSIDAKEHIAYAQKYGENPALPVYVYPDNNVIRCGSIEVRGLSAQSIPRRKPRGEPVLEKYEFIPNCTSLKISESIRVNIQLILENLPAIKVKVVELIDEATTHETQPLAPIILEVLGDLPLIRPEITVLSKNNLEISGVTVEDGKLVAQSDCHLVVGSNILQRTIILNQAFGAVKENGFILSRESSDQEIVEHSDIDLVTIHKTDTEKLVLIKKNCPPPATPTCVDVSQTTEEFIWLPDLQKTIQNNENVLIVAQDESTNGVLGLVNCLRREPGGNNVKGLFMADKAPAFDWSSDFYQAQLRKNLAINVYKNGTWGTYRHLVLDNIGEVEREHCFVNVTVRGDLSSLRWIEGPLTRDSILPAEERLVHVYYSSLNFRDIMTASGRINADVITMDRRIQECVQGFEYSGRLNDGRRVMGMMVAGGLSTLVTADQYFMWEVPDQWSLEEAATVPVVYATVIYAFFNTTTIKRGETILIHSGSGGVGQAAITVALFCGCQVYTTVGTTEKREFLKKRFPQIKDHHIGNSRDTSFETMIQEQTKGRGVDIVLNSLAGEKLEASIKCLARGGRFLEIGKFDLANNSKLKMELFKKDASFHAVMLDMGFNQEPRFKETMRQLMVKYLRLDAIKPLVRTIFKDDELEKAFRYMAAGKHIGKVMIEIRKEEKERVAVPTMRLARGISRYSCNPYNVYIVVGGLGGFGLELADWLVLRGARKIILTSRNGIKTGYQSYRTRIWRTYGTFVHISTHDVSTRTGCRQLLEEANKFGTVEAIFNLAVIIKDAILENQNQSNFKQVFEPKAYATKYLDEISRELCPNLRDFVIFSSVSCGRGNAGQTNYGMANSVMERICERRKQENLPALAIQWGAVGDVGLVAQMQEDDVQLEIGGTLQQRISSCLQVLDNLLRQDHPVVSSMVVAEKRRGAGGADNIVDAVANILGLRDTKTVSQHSTLAELGMDSMSAVEIKQTLEREFDVFLTPQDMRNMTFARLQEIQEEKLAESGTKVKKDRPITGFEMMMRLMTDEKVARIPIVKLKSKVDDKTSAPRVFFFPGMEGVSKVLEPLAENLGAHVFSVQYSYEHPEDTVIDNAKRLYEFIEPLIDEGRPFHVVGYSYGVVLAMEVVSMLEEQGHTGTLVCIDGSPYMLRLLLKNSLDVASEAYFQTGFLMQVLSLHVPFDVVMKNKDNLISFTTWEDRLKFCEEIIPNDTEHSTVYWKQFATASFNRLRALDHYEPHYQKLKAEVRLFKPEAASMANLPDDYKLNDLCENLVESRVVKGNHVTILENLDLAESINKAIGVTTEEVVIAEEEVFSKESILSDEAGKVDMAQAEIKQI